MCGFTGVLGGGACDQNTLCRMITSLHHRGPDNQGIWCDETAGIGLAFARLSILDLSLAGHQPMVSAHDRYVIVFNGEIYNHLAIRTELEKEKKVSVWSGHSDTETLLTGFEAWGIENTIKRTIGMFAIGVWDKHSCRLTLGRDRMGEKPLYYGWQGNTFLFGSELKALKEHPAFKAQINRDALKEFMRHGYIPTPLSIYQGISKLLPGTLLSLTLGENSESRPEAYWSLMDVARKGLRYQFSGSDFEALSGLETRLSEAVNSQQISDVPLGAFLSGGIDSSLIVALMQSQTLTPVHTFTIGFNEKQYNEAVYAKSVARHLGTNHSELYVSPEEARAIIPRLPTLYDEPFADSSQIPTFLVSQLARRSVTVSLSGDAGDELFGGYNRYSWVNNVMRIPSIFRKSLACGISTLSPTQWDRLFEFIQPLLPKLLQLNMPGDKAHKLVPVLKKVSAYAIYKQLISTWPEPDEIVLDGHEVSCISDVWNSLAEFCSTQNCMMILDALTYLPDDILCKVDRAAMGVSLETRVPFLDHRVVEYSYQLPLNLKIRNGQSKWILRQLLYKYVPKEMIERPKMGFGVPIDSWLRGPLKEWTEDLLNESRLCQEGYLNPVPIRKKWAEHLSGKRNWQNQLWNVLMFQAWLDESRF